MPVAIEDGTVIFVREREIRIRRSGQLESELIHRLDSYPTGLTASPDGRWIAYILTVDMTGEILGRRVARQLLKMEVDGGTPVSLLADTSDIAVSSLEWADDGWIYFEAPGFVGRVRESGGAVDTVLAPGHFHPQAALPGGRVLLVTVVDGASRSERRESMLALDLRTGDTVSVAPAASVARWSPTGHVVYSRPDGVLAAVPFDPDRLEVTGPSRPVREGATSGASFDLSSHGTLVYNTGGILSPFRGQSEYWWLGQGGAAERIPLEPIPGHTDGELSPDGKRLAYIRGRQVRVFDLDLGSDEPIGDGNHDPVWSPDGREIAFRDDARSAVIAVPSDGSGTSRVLAGLPLASPSQWLVDGTVILASFVDKDISVTNASAPPGTPPKGLLTGSWDESDPAISPDGKWIAYASAEDGVSRAYLRSWPGLSRKSLVSGADTLAIARRALLWAADSRTLYYVRSGDRALVSTRPDLTGGGAAAGRTIVARLANADLQDVDRHRRRFLIVRRSATEGEDFASTEPHRLVVVTNWFDELRGRMAARP